MILSILLSLFALKDIFQGIEKNPYFTSEFVQIYRTPEGNTIKEEGEIIFNFKKGIRFDYKGKEKKSYLLMEEGFYSREGGENWNFNPWETESEEYKFFILLIKGEVSEEENLKIEEKRDSFVIFSEKPNFKITLDKKNYFPLNFSIKSKEGSINEFDFKKHKKIYKEIKL